MPRFQQALTRAGARGAEAEDEYYRRATSFDPHASVRDVATGTIGEIMPEIRRQIERARGQMVGAGRLRTGYGEEDEDEVWNRGMSEINNRVLQASQYATGLEAQNIAGIGEHGARQSGRYLSLLSEERDREMAERDAARQRKASRWGALGGIIGGVAGTVLGPAGTAIGTRLGNAIGSRIGNPKDADSGNYFRRS